MDGAHSTAGDLGRPWAVDTAVETLTEHLPDPDLAGDTTNLTRRSSLQIRGLTTLPVRFTAAGAFSRWRE